MRSVTALSQPRLPAKTAAQVLAAAGRPHSEPRSGSFVLSTHLGLPELGSTVPGGGSTSSAIGLASGVNRGRIWSDGRYRSRVALLQPLQETDWVRNGVKTWVWDSVGSRATLVESPPAVTGGVLGALTTGTAVDAPDELAARILAFDSRSARASLLEPTRVAGRPVYRVSVSPGEAGSLVDRVVIAVDAGSDLPLSVLVYARGHTASVIDDAFTTITYAQPSTSNLSFHPPRTATVADTTTVGGLRRIFERRRRGRRRRDPGEAFDSGFGIPSGLKVTGHAWTQVVSTSGFSPWRLRSITAGKVVSGRFGTGQLVQTPLVTLLVLNDGRVAAGTVTPRVLETAMSQ